MGTLHYIYCQDCGCVRDLDKYYSLRQCDTRTQALNFIPDVMDDPFRAALALSFMKEHQNHKIVFCNEHELPDCEEDTLYMEDSFWRFDNVPEDYVI